MLVCYLMLPLRRGHLSEYRQIRAEELQHVPGGRSQATRKGPQCKNCWQTTDAIYQEMAFAERTPWIMSIMIKQRHEQRGERI